jgi:hypothetical protein
MVREHVFRKYKKGRRHDLIGLGAEGGQLGKILRRQVLVRAPPPHGPVKTGSGQRAVAELLMGHRQEEQVEGVKLAFTSYETLLQGRHRLGVPARAIERDAQRIEGFLLARSECDGALRERDGPLGIALRDGSGRVSPGRFVECPG